MLVLSAFHVMTRICRLRTMRHRTINAVLAATWPSLDLRSLVNIREQRARLEPASVLAVTCQGMSFRAFTANLPIIGFGLQNREQLSLIELKDLDIRPRGSATLIS